MPGVTTVRVLVDGEPTEAMWVTVMLHMSRKNNFRSAHGPSDARGQVAIVRSVVIETAQRDRDTFPMDYGAIDADWTGDIEVAVMNRDAITKALDAVETWGDLAWASSSEVRHGLVVAAAGLDAHDGALLTVEVVATSDGATIVPVATHA